jgi:hypothetical protein
MKRERDCQGLWQPKIHGQEASPSELSMMELLILCSPEDITEPHLLELEGSFGVLDREAQEGQGT